MLKWKFLILKILIGQIFLVFGRNHNIRFEYLIIKKKSEVIEKTFIVAVVILAILANITGKL